MEIPSRFSKDLGKRLVAVEAASDSPASTLACEKMRGPLTRLVGLEGFVALMRRSVALARADIPDLPPMTVNANGGIEGQMHKLLPSFDAEAADVAITARFLWLLVTFVGEPITIRLVSEAWPELTDIK